MLVELQALTSQSVFGYPKRTANGIDYNRLALLIAVLEKRAGMNLGNQDVYLNVVGGLKISEPSIDLGILMVTASSYKNKPIEKGIAIMGEVGLTGEVRRINMIEKRLKEAEKLVKNLNYDLVICSPMLRTKQTAQNYDMLQNTIMIILKVLML